MAYKSFLLVTLCVFACMLATSQPNIFVRVYEKSNKRLVQGNSIIATDSTIEIMYKHKPVAYPVNKIGVIKTRRTAGHAILIGSAAGTGIGLILIASASGGNGQSNFNETNFDLALVGLAMPFAGFAGSSIAAALRKREKLQVDGDIEKWKTVREKLLQMNKQNE